MRTHAGWLWATAITLSALLMAGCGGNGGSSGVQSESWASGWRRDSPRPPVADHSVYVDWTTADEHPAWSPDGRWIAFDSSRSGGGIYVVHPDGRGLRRVVASRSGEYPAWSSNSRWLAFSTREGIVVVRLDRSGRRLLVRRRDTEEPKWSADGRAIAFAVGLPDSNVDIYIRRLNEARSRLVARSRVGGVEIDSFDWSQAEHALVLTANDNRISPFDGPFLAVLSLDTGSTRFLLKHGGSYEPSWSPDGTQIAYQCEGEVCTIGANGYDRRVLTALDGAREPAWSPDGRWIVFSRGLYGNYVNPSALYRVSADGRHLRNITWG